MGNKIELPKDFVYRVKNDSFLGNELLEALEKLAPTSVRLHPRKKTHSFREFTPIPWSENGIWLKERPIFTLDPFFHAGCYYPQEAGSQLLNFALKSIELPENTLALDLCAAPGGKSSLILDHLQGNGLLVSNEIVTSRARILNENLTKWGYDNSVVVNNAPEAYDKLPNFFDLIVIDAPCSGEGMFRKDPDSRNEWSEANVEMCAERQKDIVEHVWNSLKENGYLIYSTCTFNTKENDENIAWICAEFGAEIVPVAFPDTFKTRSNTGVYALPHFTDTEGFFICVLRKTSNSSSKKSKPKGKPLREITVDKDLHRFFQLKPDNTIAEWKEGLVTFNKSLLDEFTLISQHLNVFKLGLPVAETTRKGWIPNEALAFSESVSEKLKRIHLSKKEALTYLKGDTFTIESDNGYALMCYENIPLGFIKQIGNRFNNNYPKEWRIRMKID